MDLGAVMDEIGDRFDTIDGLRVYRYPPDSISVPAAIVSYPDLNFDETMARGMDRYSLDVIVLVSNAYARSARDRIAKYVKGSGGDSVKAAVETHDYQACDSVRVESATSDFVSWEGVTYLAYTFTIDIAGTGA